MRVVLPYHPAQRFEASTPTSRLLSWVMPWAQGRRPAWLLRLGLFIYDHLGPRRILPGTRKLDLTKAPEGAPLQDHYATAFEYSDCWVEDSRLVVLTARDAADRGAAILTRTKVISAKRAGSLWEIRLEGPDGPRQVTAAALVNAAGPWVEDVLRGTLGQNSAAGVRLVRGSHLVVRKLYDHDKAYFLQGRDGRIMFAIPYEGAFTLLGTTDADHPDPSTKPGISPEERDYILAFASEYFAQPVTEDDVVWSYSGVRPLYDDGAASASAATRDYVLDLETREGAAPVLHVFGGKITTFRRLAEEALEKLHGVIEIPGKAWTAVAPLPGGDFPVKGVDELIVALRDGYPFLDAAWATRLIKAYGRKAWDMLGAAKTASDLGVAFGETLTEAECRYLVAQEFACGPSREYAGSGTSL